MAILIPSLGFARFDTRGELRLAERLKDFLEENAGRPIVRCLMCYSGRYRAPRQEVEVTRENDGSDRRR
jgi:hypothetical protein